MTQEEKNARDITSLGEFGSLDGAKLLNEGFTESKKVAETTKGGASDFHTNNMSDPLIKDVHVGKPTLVFGTPELAASTNNAKDLST